MCFVLSFWPDFFHGKFHSFFHGKRSPEIKIAIWQRSFLQFEDVSEE